jgi:hypothetical protein
MKVSYLLLISLLIVGALFVSAVSAKTLIDDEPIIYEDTGGTLNYDVTAGYLASQPVNRIRLESVESHPLMPYIAITVSNTGDSSLVKNLHAEGEYHITYTAMGQTKTATLYVEYSKNYLGTITHARYLIFFDDWDTTGYTGHQYITLSETLWTGALKTGNTDTSTLACVASSGGAGRASAAFTITVASVNEWKNRLIVTDDILNSYQVDLQRVYGGDTYPSEITILKGDSTVFYEASASDFSTVYLQSEMDAIKIQVGSDIFQWHLEPAGSDDPEEPTVFRTGTVTMTDHNGTTITGFEVTAVNHYTGEEYTVVTETDVAVMTLPMDRTIRLRNPQTGEYEDIPVGYYRFYGQSPGYKMLSEEGIQVSVLPENIISYQICDIRVTPESGPLTGKHLFQIRSRADNSILQTGTISAKSATTGAWYNGSVTDGLGTLILPYDTSNSLSPYAGNYAIYATSPGYEDSDFGTQIVVMPHTESEIYDVHLTPIGGIPTPGNVTLRIQAFSETGPGVVNAEIFIAGADGAGESVWDTYFASSTGYLAVSVPGNSTYDIVASGAGFYDSARRVTVYDDDPPLIEIKLYLTGAPTLEPTTQPTGWPTGQPTTQPTGGIPDEDDDSEGFLMQAVRGIGLAFGVGFATAKLIFGMLLALSIGYATAKQLRGGAAEFGLGLLGGTLLGVLIGLLPVWIIVVLLLVVGLYIGNRYVGGESNNG